MGVIPHPSTRYSSWQCILVHSELVNNHLSGARKREKRDQAIISHITTVNPAAAWGVTLICVGHFSRKTQQQQSQYPRQRKRLEDSWQSAALLRAPNNLISMPADWEAAACRDLCSYITAAGGGGNYQSAPGVWKHSLRMLECSLFVINWPTCLVNLCSNCSGGSVWPHSWNEGMWLLLLSNTGFLCWTCNADGGNQRNVFDLLKFCVSTDFTHLPVCSSLSSLSITVIRLLAELQDVSIQS